MMDQTALSILNQADTCPDLASIGKLVKLQELIVESDYQTDYYYKVSAIRCLDLIGLTNLTYLTSSGLVRLERAQICPLQSPTMTARALRDALYTVQTIKRTTLVNNIV